MLLKMLVFVVVVKMLLLWVLGGVVPLNRHRVVVQCLPILVRIRRQEVEEDVLVEGGRRRIVLVTIMMIIMPIQLTVSRGRKVTIPSYSIHDSLMIHSN